MDKIAVLIPCYNEEKTIAKVVRDAKAALPEAVVYVYDNNSSDRTVELAREAGAVIRHEYMQGKGNVIRRMFREIEAECYITHRTSRKRDCVGSDLHLFELRTLVSRNLIFRNVLDHIAETFEI